MDNELIRVDMMFKYTIQIFYSEEDEGYIAVVPELEGCSALGETPNEALDEVMNAIQTWIDFSEEMGMEVSEPSKRSLLSSSTLKDPVGEEIGG